MIVITDSEYTTWPGALESGWEGRRREIVQLAAIRVDDAYNEVASLSMVVRPTFEPVVSDLFVKLTGIGRETVLDGIPFHVALKAFEAFSWCTPILCMNADEAVMRENCQLNGMFFPFKPFHRLRPYLEGLGFNMTNMSSGDLHAMTDDPIFEAHTHDALHDARSMAHWLRHSKLADPTLLPTGMPVRDPRSQT